MIGNDIVDLNLAKKQSNWQRKGFLDKIFTIKEQKFIKNANDSFTAVWLLWSMKESAYKIYSRQNNVRFFAPNKFDCEINNAQNIVKVNGIKYYTSSAISKNSIHTITTLNVDEIISSDFFKLKNNAYAIQHSTTYDNLKIAIANQFNIPISKVKIEKDRNGIPLVKHSGVTSSGVEKSSISISHHGVFGAYAFVK